MAGHAGPPVASGSRKCRQRCEGNALDRYWPTAVDHHDRCRRRPPYAPLFFPLAPRRTRAKILLEAGGLLRLNRASEADVVFLHRGSSPRAPRSFHMACRVLCRMRCLRTTTMPSQTWAFTEELRHAWKDDRFEFEVNVV